MIMPQSPGNQIQTVSELTADIQQLIEDAFPFVWVSGEISNFSVPPSGHFYFTLKDDKAQIRAVMFRSQNRNLRFMPENGMSLTGLGRIGVYAPRGVYQIIFEHLEPSGLGALQAAFEQLKETLSTEGLFDTGHKRPLPSLPRRICIITSPTGAVVHDFIRIALRRYPNLIIQVIPVSVQGDGAVDDIVRALSFANAAVSPDIVVLARGGGSLEDLQAFNSEAVARAIFASKVPVVSAVGHETDVTIADFVADLRAPTPSAAAEMTIPLRSELDRHCLDMVRSLSGLMLGYLDRLRTQATDLEGRFTRAHPLRQVEQLRMRLDDHTDRMARSFRGRIAYDRERFGWLSHRLTEKNPIKNINKFKENIDVITDNLIYNFNILTERLRHHVGEAEAMLHAMNPENILARGYSITRTVPEGRIVREARDVFIDQRLDITVAEGRVRAQVLERHIPETTSHHTGTANGSETDL